MKVGIIVHSHTGNTLSVAEKMKETLLAAGHTVNLERVEAVNEDPNEAMKTELKTAPDITGYDAYVFGAPIRAFSLSPVMLKYLKQVSSMDGKKASCFVTQQFPFAWMGGNRGVKQMKNACLTKGAEILDIGVVNWSSKKREDMITDVVSRLCKLS
ncbi:flavodoxin [Mobilitalea sibirica]|uniref:Flavodoxin n=1 Tax=Mobilitalea sibirica TaxID=1462919 RepID=A0A8J7H952_9FIRM|nr:flavodoxin [Mobilitalea sibirica]MBH1941791.1 flavodoxin [Mobilitalea sibirica]